MMAGAVELHTVEIQPVESQTTPRAILVRSNVLDLVVARRTAWTATCTTKMQPRHTCLLRCGTHVKE